MTALEITVFSRPGCHLCDRTLDEIRGIVGDGEGVVLEVIDIESSDELLAVYLERIPVVAVNGVTVSELEFDSHAFRDAIGLAPGAPGQVA